MRSCTWMAALAAGLTFSALTAAPRVAWAASVASIRITPSGATLRAGDTQQFTAEALNKKGNPISGVSIRWSSDLTRVARVSSGGVVTGAQNGVANIFARAGGKKASVRVAVVAPNSSTLATAAAGLDQVNHVASDGDYVYWTEVNKQKVKVRRVSINGGPIVDLASQNYKDSRQITYSAVHLKIADDYVYWTRQAVGFNHHWAIFRVLKSGGTPERVLTDDVAIEPLVASFWQVTGKYLVVALARPEQLGLTENTRVGVYNTETKIWSPLLTATFPAGRVAVIAADNNFVYLRGITSSKITRILRLSPSDGESSSVTLVSQDRADNDAGELAASDGTNLFFWSKQGSGDHRLMRVAVEGNQAASVLLSGNFGEGLVTDGTHLYWARGGSNLVRLPNTGGGSPTQLQTGLYKTATTGGVGLSDTRVFYVRKQGKRFTILGQTK